MAEDSLACRPARRRSARRLLGPSLAALSVAVACGCSEPPEIGADASAQPAPGSAAHKPELVPIASGSDSGRERVLREITRAQSDGRALVIYVGASWCEPCQAFHAALTAGKLDSELSNVRFLELDFDQHEGLLAEGDMACTSKLIPLFALPEPDGRCGARRIEGGIKGDGAVGHIMPRLRALLGR